MDLDPSDIQMTAVLVHAVMYTCSGLSPDEPASAGMILSYAPCSPRFGSIREAEWMTSGPGVRPSEDQSLVPAVGVLRETGTLYPNDTEALAGGRLHHHPALQAVCDLGA
jgi:hypothetical protein